MGTFIIALISALLLAVVLAIALLISGAVAFVLSFGKVIIFAVIVWLAIKLIKKIRKTNK